MILARASLQSKLPLVGCMVHAVACSATASLSLSIKHSILLRKFVPAHTMSFPRMLCTRANAPQDVFSLCNGFQMCRIYAMSNSAQMINLEMGGNFPLEQDVRETMSFLGLNGVYTKLTIFFGAHIPRPQPTSFGKINIKPKTKFGWDSLWTFLHRDCMYLTRCSYAS